MKKSIISLILCSSILLQGTLLADSIWISNATKFPANVTYRYLHRDQKDIAFVIQPKERKYFDAMTITDLSVYLLNEDGSKKEDCFVAERLRQNMANWSFYNHEVVIEKCKKQSRCAGHDYQVSPDSIGARSGFKSSRVDVASDAQAPGILSTQVLPVSTQALAAPIAIPSAAAPAVSRFSKIRKKAGSFFEGMKEKKAKAMKLLKKHTPKGLIARYKETKKAKEEAEVKFNACMNQYCKQQFKERNDALRFARRNHSRAAWRRYEQANAKSSVCGDEHCQKLREEFEEAFQKLAKFQVAIILGVELGIFAIAATGLIVGAGASIIAEEREMAERERTAQKRQVRDVSVQVPQSREVSTQTDKWNVNPLYEEEEESNRN